MAKTNKVMYWLGYVGILLAAFSWGWNYSEFNNK